jgi:hypothetical protein
MSFWQYNEQRDASSPEYYTAECALKDIKR